MATNGLITLRSGFGPQETMARLRSEVAAKGMAVFAHIDHAAGATEVGLTLGPTDLLIFGNARGGTPLMQAAPSAAIDLPLKLLVSEDEQGKVWISYNSPEYLAERHGLSGELLQNIAVVKTLAEKAAE